MPLAIPFLTSDNNYELTLPIDDTTIKVDVHWNSQDDDNVGAWYIDIRTQDDEAIAIGIKIVLGVNLARASTHPFLQKYLLTVIDTTALGRDAGYDDLGARIAVLIYTRAEILELLS